MNLLVKQKAEVRVFPTLEELSRQAASQFEELAYGRVAPGQIFAAALSGGSTPKRLYELLASPDFSPRIPWESVHLFQVDERCVSPDHPQSNSRMIREALLSRAPVPEANFHRIAAERANREEAAWHYAEAMARVLRTKEDEWPRLDLVLLGMGADGHTASLFPGSPALDEQVLWVRPNFVAKPEMQRITLTFPVLNSAARLIFLVAGSEKAETLYRVLEGPLLPEQFPVQRVQPLAGQVSWYVDEAAARLLKSPARSA